MMFSDSTNQQGLVQDITFITGANLASDYKVKERTRNINTAYGKVASIIMKADGRWQWDDPNHTNNPTAACNLVDGQESYAVMVPAPTALHDWLMDERVEILDTNDNGKLIQPFDKNDLGVAWSEYAKTDSTPECYEFRGASIFLKPNPNYDKTEGCIITFKRNPSYFAAAGTDTTKVPGFARPFHRYLSLSASYDWFLKIGKTSRASAIKNDMNILEFEIMQFYGKRDKYERSMLSRAKKSYK